MAFLRTLEGRQDLLLRDKLTVLGRDPSCDIRVGASHVSRRHALILELQGVCHVEDLDSVNGTYLNGQRLTQRARLTEGDRIGIAEWVAIFHEGQPSHVGAGPGGVEMTVAGGMPVITSLEAAGSLRVEVAPEAKLRAVLELSQNLGGALDLADVLPRSLESLFNVFPQAERGFVLLADPETGELTPAAVRSRSGRQADGPGISQTILDHAVRTGRAILSADAGSDERFDVSQSIRRLELRSIMCAPMLSRTGACLGVVQLDARDPRHRFNQGDLDVLLIASTQAARAVELARLHKERRDLEAATEIQKSFLPDQRPDVPGLRFFDHYTSALHIGGDYYDYIPLPGDRLAVALGDVAGKGAAAALLMARLSAAVRFCLASEPRVAEAVRRLNLLMTRAGSADRYVTFVVAVLDRGRSSLTLVNAGHLPPLRRRGGRREVEEVGEEAAGLPLGVFDRPYEEVTVPLEPGDAWVLFTDGVTEARNPKKELYGKERLKAVVQRAPADVEKLGEALLADVHKFAEGARQSDDLTVVAFGRTSG
jgi:serine phosphatase RsbU (regulator of sigma subunit)